MTDMTDKPDTPVLDRLLEVSKITQPAGAFLEWLLQNGNVLCQWHNGYMELDEGETEDDLEQDIDNPEGYYPIHINIQDLLAKWQSIDQQKAEKERVALLDWHRTLTAAEKEA